MDVMDLDGSNNLRPILLPMQVFRAQIKDFYNKVKKEPNCQKKFLEEIDSIEPEYSCILVSAYLELLLMHLVDSPSPADIDNFNSLIEHCSFNFFNWPSLISQAIRKCNLEFEYFCSKIFNMNIPLPIKLIITLSSIYGGNDEQVTSSFKCLESLFPLLKNLNSKLSESVLSRLVYWIPKLSLSTEIQILVFKHLDELNDNRLSKSLSLFNLGSMECEETNEKDGNFNMEDFIVNQLNIPVDPQDSNLTRIFTESTLIRKDNGVHGNHIKFDDQEQAVDALKMPLSFVPNDYQVFLPTFVSLSDILYDFGYCITHSLEALNFLFFQFQSIIDEYSISKIVIMMCQNTEGLRSYNHPILLNGITLNTESGCKKGWNVEFFVSSIQLIRPRLNWSKVLDILAYGEDEMIAEKNLNWSLLHLIYQSANGQGLQASWAFSSWRYKSVQFSLLQFMLYNSDKFVFTGCEEIEFGDISQLLDEHETRCCIHKNFTNVKGKAKKKTKEKKDEKKISIFPWRFLSVSTIFLEFAEEFGYVSEVSELFRECIASFPEMLFLNLSQCKMRSSLLGDLMVQIVSILYFGDRQAIRCALEHVWSKSPAIVVKYIKKLYEDGTYSLHTIYEVLNSRFCILESFLGFVLASRFGIDLVEIANRKGGLDLDGWMKRYMESPECDMCGVLGYLRDHGDSIVWKAIGLMLNAIYLNVDLLSEDMKIILTDLISRGMFVVFEDDDMKRLSYYLNASIKFQEEYMSILLDGAMSSSEFADNLALLLVKEYEYFCEVPIYLLQPRARIVGDFIYYGVNSSYRNAILSTIFASLGADSHREGCRTYGLIALFRIMMRIYEYPSMSHSLCGIAEFKVVRDIYDLVSFMKVLMGPSPLNSSVKLKFLSKKNEKSCTSEKICPKGGSMASERNRISVDRDGSGISKFFSGESMAHFGWRNRMNNTAFDLVNLVPMVVQPDPYMRDKINFVLNTINRDNLNQRIQELKSILKPQYYDYYAQQLTVNQVPNNIGHHLLYVELNNGLRSSELNEAVLAWTYFTITSILQLSTAYSRYLVKLLKIFGSWLGLITLSQNKPILHVFLPLKDLLIRSWANGKLKFVMLMVSKVFLCPLGIFSPPNPWTVAILRLYKEFYVNPSVSDFLKQDIEVLFRHLKIDLDKFEGSNILQQKVNSMGGTIPPLFKNPPIYVLIRMRGSIFESVGTSYQQNLFSSRPAEPLNNNLEKVLFSLVPSAEGQSPKKNVFDGNFPNDTSQTQQGFNRKNGVQIDDPGAMGAGQMPPSFLGPSESNGNSSSELGGGVEHGGITGNFYMPQLFATPKIDLLFNTFPRIKKCLYMAFQNSIEKFLTMVSNQILSFTLTTTCSLVLKDFALESDQMKILSAAQSMIHGLCYSFTSITGWRSLKVSIIFQLKKILESMDESNAETLKKAVDLNLNQACLVVHEALIKKALKLVEINLRSRLESGPDYQNVQNLQLSQFSQIRPELIKVRRGVYERFRILDDVRPELIKVFNQAKMFVEVISGKAADMDIPLESWPELDDALAHLITMIINKPFVILNLTAFVLDQLESLCKNQPVVLNVEIWYLLVLGIVSRFFGMTEKIWERICQLQMHQLPDLLLGLIHWNVIPCHWIDMTLGKDLKKLYLALKETTQVEEKNKFIQSLRICAHLIQASIIDTKWLKVSNFPCLIGFFELVLSKDPDAFSNLKVPLVNLFMMISKLEMKEKGLYSNLEQKNTSYIPKKGAAIPEKDTTNSSFNLSALSSNHDTSNGDGFQGGRSASLTSSRGSEITSTDKVQMFQDGNSRIPESVMKMFNTQYNALLNRQKALCAVVPNNLLVWFSNWIELTNTERHNEKVLQPVLEQLRLQNLITLKSADVECFTYRGIIEAAVLSYLLFSHYQNVMSYQLMLSVEVPSKNLVMSLTLKPYSAAEACSFLVVTLLKYHRDASFLPVFLKQLSLALKEDYMANKMMFNPLPYYWIVSRFIYFLKMESGLDFHSTYWVTCIAEFLSDIAPNRVPGFVFVWLDLLSNRELLPQFLQNRQGWPVLHKLVLCHLSFLGPYLSQSHLNSLVGQIYEATMRIFLVLLHDCPKFLVTFHHQFCDALPSSCIQLRNLILSAFPPKMKLPDPTVFFSWSQMTLTEPPLYKKFLRPLIDSNLKDSIEMFLMQGDVDNDISNGFLEELGQSLFMPTGLAHLESETKYNIPLINSMVLYANIIPHTSQENLDKLILHLLEVLDNEGRYYLLNSFFNQIRYPNVHTRLFINHLLRYWGEAKNGALNDTQKIITRILIERLNAKRPHPWGLIVFSRELSSNEKYGFVNILEYCEKDPYLSAAVSQLLKQNYLVNNKK